MKHGVMSKQVISFCLFGDEDKYCIGAIRNAELIPKVYPGWVMRVYVAQSVPDNIRCKLASFSYVELVHCKEDNWTSMLTRFLPMVEENVEVTISRDCDSRLSVREAEAVAEWLSGPKLIHVMRDHPHHSAPIMGGLWGAKSGALPNLVEQIETYTKGDFWQVDQNFLREVVWPANYHKVLAHDDWNRFPQAETKPFPTPREADDFVGSIIGPDDERLHPEHHEGLTG